VPRVVVVVVVVVGGGGSSGGTMLWISARQRVETTGRS